MVRASDLRFKQFEHLTIRYYVWVPEVCSAQLLYVTRVFVPCTCIIPYVLHSGQNVWQDARDPECRLAYKALCMYTVKDR